MDDTQLLAGAMRKAMWRILPLILMAYVIAYIDRVNVSFAALQMNVDLGFSATVYGLGGGMFFLSYALFEIPSSLLMQRVGARRWLVRIMLTWGVIAMAMMFIRTPLQFYIMRFLLGVAEAGFYPTVMFYFAGWFPTAFRGRAISRIYIAGPVGSLVMGAISGWLLALDGAAGLAGWQWLFLVQGLPGLVLAAILWRWLPDAPADVAWLTPAEKARVADELARDAVAIGQASHHGVRAVLANPIVWLLGAIGLLGNLAVTGLLLTAPAVLAESAGLGSIGTGTLVGFGGAIGIAAVLSAGWFSDRHGDRLRDASVVSSVMAASLLLIGLAVSPGLVMLGYLGFALCIFTSAFLVSSSGPDLLPVGQVAVGVAANNTLWQFGAFASPFVTGFARDATGNYALGLYGAASVAVVQVAVILYLRRRVRAGRAARGIAIPA